MNREKLWTKEFITLSVVNFIIALIFYLLLVTIASYAINRFHTSTGVAGLVSSIFVIGALFGRLGIGRIIDDVENRKILIVSIIFFAIPSALYFVATSLPLLILIRILQGMAFGVATTTIATIVAQILPANRLGEGLSYFSISIILATAIGPFIGILLTEYADFNVIFIFNLILAILCFFMLSYNGFNVTAVPLKTHRVTVKCDYCGMENQTTEQVEKGVDIALATDLISFAMDDQYDTAVIVSGDYDYFRAIEEVQRRGKKVEIAYFLIQGITEEFIQVADKFISLNGIADKISKE